MSVSTKGDGSQRALEQQRIQEERARDQERLRAEAKRKVAAEAASGKGAGKSGQGNASGVTARTETGDSKSGSVVSRLLDDAKKAASRGFDIVADHAKNGIDTLNGAAKSGFDAVADTASQGAEIVGDAAKKGFDAVSGAVTDGVKSMLGGVDEAISGASEAMNVREGVEELNGAGDSLYLRATPEAKVEGRWRVFDVGVKGQLGSDIRITRDSDDADSGYTVRYDKHSLGALTGGVGTPGGSVDAKAKLEAGLQTFDAVEMKFDNKEDAIRAGEILQRLQVADGLDDGISAAMGTNPLMAPLRGVDDLVSQVAGQDLTLSGGANPLGNPLHDDGAPGGVAKLIAGVSQDDLSFLGDNVSAYESTLGTRSRLSAEVSAKLGPLNGALEGRIDGTQRVTRRVELPTDDQDGRVTYSVSGGLRLSAKEKLQRKGSFNAADLFPDNPKGSFQMGVDNRLELASGSLTASVSYTIPKGTDLTTSGGTRVWPEFDALTDKADLQFENIQLRATTEWRNQGFEDLSRGDSTRMTETLTLTDPAGAVDAAKDLFAGDWQGAAQEVGAKLDIEQTEIARSGVDIQPGVKVGVKGLLTVEGSVILQAGVDDITARRSMAWDPNAPVAVDPAPQDPALPPEPEFPAAPVDDGATLVTVPTEGLYVRNGPDGEAQGLLQNGTFLRDRGGRQTGADGREWIEVTGTDLNDRPVSGWVAADYVAGHDSAKGAMDATGRVNPSLEHDRYAAITVQKDDNLWDLARQHGVDPQEMIALNRDHLINPSLIYAGDTVYLPGTAKGPEPLPAPPVAPAPEPVEDASGSTGSDSAASSGDSSASGSDSTDTGSSGNKSGPSPAPSTPAPSEPATPAPVPSSGSDTGLSGTGEPKSGPAEVTAEPPRPVPQVADRAGMDRILRDYQVAAEDTVTWRPKAAIPGAEAIASGLGGVIDFFGGGGAGEGFADKVSRAANLNIPATEAAALDRLGPIDQAKWLMMSDEVSDRALSEYQGQRPDGMSSPDWQNDGHVDAFRHALWNARMTKEFGAEWTEGYATAHEKVEGNPATREAMDLYNNEVGRRIATENPDASDEELAVLVRRAIDDGEMMVIDTNGDLQHSNTVAVGAHGEARGGEAEANPDREAEVQDSKS